MFKSSGNKLLNISLPEYKGSGSVVIGVKCSKLKLGLFSNIPPLYNKFNASFLVYKEFLLVN